MDISKSAFKNNRVTLIAILSLCLIGLYSYKHMPKAQDPGFRIRNAQIITHGVTPTFKNRESCYGQNRRETTEYTRN